MSCTLPPESAAGVDSPGIAPIQVHQAIALELSLLAEQPGSAPEVRTWVDEADLARASIDVARAREQAEIVLVALHLGVPAPWRPPSASILAMYERPLCHALIDAGADAIIGNHAHELHGIEFHQGKPIAYCLGNFWIDALDDYPWMERESVLCQLTFPPASSIPEVTLIPLRLDDTGVPRPDPTAGAIAILQERSDGPPLVFDRTDSFYTVHSKP
jgi:poly-gamma-glutamate capsule biosynthesis protein CapA/YwtB (metallophosphatase superfamily)